MKIELFVFVCVCVVGVILGDSVTPTPTTTLSTTTPTVAQECAGLNASCEICAKHVECLWCNGRGCMPYPVGEIIPSEATCPLDKARWGVCWVNYKILLIVMGCVAGVLLLSFTCCIYCCCCRRKSANNRASLALEEEQYDQERQDRQAKHTERRAERQGRVDEIRRKYGLVKDSDSSYQRFDNEA